MPLTRAEANYLQELLGGAPLDAIQEGQREGVLDEALDFIDQGGSFEDASGRLRHQYVTGTMYDDPSGEAYFRGRRARTASAWAAEADRLDELRRNLSGEVVYRGTVGERGDNWEHMYRDMVTRGEVSRPESERRGMAASRAEAYGTRKPAGMRPSRLTVPMVSTQDLRVRDVIGKQARESGAELAERAKGVTETAKLHTPGELKRIERAFRRGMVDRMSEVSKHLNLQETPDWEDLRTVDDLLERVASGGEHRRKAADALEFARRAAKSKKAARVAKYAGKAGKALGPLGTAAGLLALMPAATQAAEHGAEESPELAGDIMDMLAISTGGPTIEEYNRPKQGMSALFRGLFQ